ncbi:unnamed protein product [Phaedon cochleariae]|uniref:Uncharacterized protein n=1 Tax=Phaedon cochleariae TaxID=80249 RepID=A0A9N9SPI5_PHACE|nr:unnamed protein product [Phaedon cochleariae]
MTTIPPPFCTVFVFTRFSPEGMEADVKKVRLTYLLWIPILVCCAMLFYVDVFQVQYYNIIQSNQISDLNLDKKTLEGFLINTPGCRIPDMDPFDEHIKKYMEIPKVPLCNKGIPPLFASNLSSVYLLESSMDAYDVTDIDELKCCYKPFWRKTPTEGQNDNKITYSENCYNFSRSVTVKEEWIKIICTHNDSTIYEDLFSFIPVKIHDTTTSGDSLNILIWGVDAVSRLNLHRQMPETVKQLKQIGAVELLGYNKVGDNTFPNLMPVLTGMTEKELTENCWPKENAFFDDCPFLWKDYKKKGFVTAYGEDSSWMGLFNYQRNGFQNQTVDYAYNYFNRESERALGNSHNMNVDECVGGRLVYKDFLEYIKRFVITMDGNSLPYFGFFWAVGLSHDYLNKPKLGDGDYATLLKTLKDGGHLENTVLILMSDHGIRWGAIRETFQGMMEERLPFVFMVLPEWYKYKYQKAYQNLMINERRLTTPFDLHETLLDLLHPFNLTEENLEASGTSNKRPRGVSFFRSISKNRTCEEAGIASHWCTCQQSVEVDANATNVLEAAAFAVGNMNQQLKGYAQCAILNLDAVLSARLMTHTEEITGEHKIQDYMLTLRTLPGAGVFEVTVRYMEEKNTYSITGTISRLNLYGQQSSCITDFHLKLYCYCKSLLSHGFS